MKKNLFFNLVFVTAINLLVKPIWIFGIDRGIQNSVDLASYGMYFAAFNISLIFNSLLDFGLTNYNTQHIAKYPVMFEKYFKNIVGVKLLLGFFYLFVVLIFYLFTAQKSNLEILFALAISQFLSSFLLYLRSNISAHQFFFTDSLFSVLDKILMLLFGTLILWNKSGLDDLHILRYFSYAQTLAIFMACVLALIVNIGMTPRFRIQWKPALMWVLLKRSWPYATYILISTIYFRYDSFILQTFYHNGNELVGTYAQAFRLVDAFNTVGYLMSGILFPLLARYLVQNLGAIPNLLKQSANVLLSLFITVCVMVYFFAEDIYALLYPNTNHVQFLKITIWMLIPLAFHHVYSSFLTASEKIWLLNKISLLALVIGILLNILVFRFQKLEYVIAINIIAQVIVSVLLLQHSVRNLSIKMFALIDYKLLIFTTLLVLSQLVLKTYFDFSFVVKLSLFSAFSMVLAFILNLVPIKGFISAKPSNQ